MNAKAKYRLKGKARDSYLELIRDFPLAAIGSDEHLLEAQKVLDRLLQLDPLDHGQETYLEALSELVAAYEDEHHPIPAASDADMLRHLMEARGVTMAELSRATGLTKATLAEILTGRKRFTQAMVRAFAEFFQVEANVLAPDS